MLVLHRHYVNKYNQIDSSFICQPLTEGRLRIIIHKFMSAHNNAIGMNERMNDGTAKIFYLIFLYAFCGENILLLLYGNNNNFSLIMWRTVIGLSILFVALKFESSSFNPCALFSSAKR